MKGEERALSAEVKARVKSQSVKVPIHSTNIHRGSPGTVLGAGNISVSQTVKSPGSPGAGLHSSA